MSQQSLAALQKTLLAGLIKVPSDHVDTLHQRMQQVQIYQENLGLDLGVYKDVWARIKSIYLRFNGMPDMNLYITLIANSPGDKYDKLNKEADLYKELIDSDPVSDGMFQGILVTLEESVMSLKFRKILNTGNKICEDGVVINKETRQGLSDGVQFVKEALTRLENSKFKDADDAGNINEECDRFVELYQAIKEDGIEPVKTGFNELDNSINGLYPGDLVLLAAYTSQGKSKMATEIGYNAAYRQGKNVLFLVNEITRTQLQRNIVVRHSWSPQVLSAANADRGLRITDVKFARLSDKEEEVLNHTLHDMKSNSYGVFYAATLPSRVGMEYVCEQLESCSAAFNPDLLVIDYLGLMKGSRRTTSREELDDLLVNAKRAAVDYNIPLVSPWQTSRVAKEEMERTGNYSITALADSSQAEKSSDIVMALIYDPDDNRLKCQILKNRDGDADVTFDLTTDFATGRLTDISRVDFDHRNTGDLFT